MKCFFPTFQERVIYFLCCRLQDREINPRNALQMRKALSQNFFSSSFTKEKGRKASNPPSKDNQSELMLDNLFLIPVKNKDDSSGSPHESYDSALWKLRDQVSPSSVCLYADNSSKENL